jgi:hypothetical protein
LANAGTSFFAPAAKGAEAIVNAPKEDAFKKSLLFMAEFYLILSVPVNLVSRIRPEKPQTAAGRGSART